MLFKVYFEGIFKGVIVYSVYPHKKIAVDQCASENFFFRVIVNYFNFNV